MRKPFRPPGLSIVVLVLVSTLMGMGCVPSLKTTSTFTSKPTAIKPPNEWVKASTATRAGFTAVDATSDGFIAVDNEAGPYESSDGMTWRASGTEGQWNSAHFAATAVSSSGVMIAGHVLLGDDDANAAIWVLTEPDVWVEMIGGDFGGPGFQGIESLDSSEELLVAVGSQWVEQRREPLAWVASVGAPLLRVDLARLEATPPFEGRVYDVEVDGRHAVAVGVLGGKAAYWMMEDFGPWIQGFMPAPLGQEPAESTAWSVSKFGGGFIAVGNANGPAPGDSSPRVWLTGDGRDWQPIVPESAEPGGMSAITSFDGGLLAVGTANTGLDHTNHWDCQNQLWHGAMMVNGAWAWDNCSWSTPKVDDVAGVNAIY